MFHKRGCLSVSLTGSPLGNVSHCPFNHCPHKLNNTCVQPCLLTHGCWIRPKGVKSGQLEGSQFIECNQTFYTFIRNRIQQQLAGSVVVARLLHWVHKIRVSKTNLLTGQGHLIWPWEALSQSRGSLQSVGCSTRRRARSSSHPRQELEKATWGGGSYRQMLRPSQVASALPDLVTTQQCF